MAETKIDTKIIDNDLSSTPQINLHFIQTNVCEKKCIPSNQIFA